VSAYPPASEALIGELRQGVHPKVERLSLSLPPDLASWVKVTAASAGCTVSYVVEVALRRYQESSR
jgi:hypothetical protein